MVHMFLWCVFSEERCEHVMVNENNNENVFVFSEYTGVDGSPTSTLLSPEIFNPVPPSTDNIRTPDLDVLITGTTTESIILTKLEIKATMNGLPLNGVTASIRGANIEPIEVNKRRKENVCTSI